MPPRRAPLFVIAALAVASCRSPKRDAAVGADCPAAVKSGALPATPAEAEAWRARGSTWSDADVRARYVCWVAEIGPLDAKWKAEGLGAEARARRAYDRRHEARLTARAMMSDPAEVSTLRARDTAKYGNPDGPTYEWLVQRAKDKGLTGDAVFEEIVRSAQQTDRATNERFGL
jgi:hypothetical protein